MLSPALKRTKAGQSLPSQPGSGSLARQETGPSHHSLECRGKATARVFLLEEGARQWTPERDWNLDLPA